ncbi:single-stranded-DNA-specific exonuclease RecJ [Orbaceae bacterium ac157xtp]
MNDIIIKQRITPKEVTLSSELHPLLKRLYTARGVTSDEELNNSTNAMLNYKLLAGIDNATNLLYDAVVKQKTIWIVGDFDTDGATSTALLYTALTKFGIKNIHYLIPDRFEDGYGLSVSVVQRVKAQGAELIITVDNGVSAIEAVDYAKQNGIDVIITDHHLAPDVLPNADAIINPNLKECGFPSKNLAGVGVTFYFMLAFRAKLREIDWFQKNTLVEYNIANLLDLVALGTIADLVNLDHNNRILVQQGLHRIRAGYCCPGIKALIRITNRNMANITAQDLSYYLAPRINAAGRMENMSLGVELLLAQDEPSALEVAQLLDNLNSERKRVEQNMHQEAMVYINEIENNTKTIPNTFVLHHPDFHQGVIGVLSSKIKERFYRPVFSFAVSEKDYLKGSGRSIDGIHLRDILENINMRDPSLIVCFGGHAMAAGLTIKQQNLEKFTHYFEEAVSKIMLDSSLTQAIITDGELESEYLNLETAKAIRAAGPWGSGFPEPYFNGEFIVHQQKIVAIKHLRLVLEPVSGGQLINAIAFNIDPSIWPDNSVDRIKAVYQIEVAEFRGNQSLNMLIRHIQAIG